MPSIHLVRIDCGELAVDFDVRGVGADIHQLADAAPAAADRDGLKELADLVEQHDGDGFDIITGRCERQGERADGGDGHEKAFVKDLPVQDALPRLFQDIVSDDPVGDEVQEKAGGPGDRKKMQQDEQRGRHEDALQYLLLLLIHK